MANKHWTVDEDKVLYSQVVSSPQKLNTAFLAASQILGRSKGACASRWYGYVSKDKKYPAFVLVSGKHKALNRRFGNGEPSNEGFFKRIIHLLFGI